MDGAPKGLLRDRAGVPLVARLFAEHGPGRAELALATTERWASLYARAVCAPVLLDPGLGPACALALACRALRAPWIALVAADTIGFPRGSLAELTRAAGPGIDAVVTGLGEPMPGIYRREAVATLGSLEGEGLRRGVLSRLRVKEAPWVPAPAADLDTAEDLARWLSSRT